MRNQFRSILKRSSIPSTSTMRSMVIITDLLNSAIIQTSRHKEWHTWVVFVGSSSWNPLNFVGWENGMSSNATIFSLKCSRLLIDANRLMVYTVSAVKWLGSMTGTELAYIYSVRRIQQWMWIPLAKRRKWLRTQWSTGCPNVHWLSGRWMNELT